MQPGERRGVELAVLAVVCFSFGAVLTIWADPLSPYEKTAGRLAIGSMAVLTISLAQRRAPHYSRPDAPRFLWFGLVAAVHFLCFMGSLSYTTIAHALTLTYTSPVFVTLFSAVFLKEPMARRQYVSIGAVILGIAILVGFQPQLDSRMLAGDGMALMAAIAGGVYSVIGRSQRDRYPLLTYAFATYAVAGLWLLPAAWLTFDPTHYGARQLLALLALGVLPLAVGHTLYNAAVRHTHATYVNVIATQEITGGMLLGLVLLGQLPTPNSVLGAGITLAGIALVLFSG